MYLYFYALFNDMINKSVTSISQPIYLNYKFLFCFVSFVNLLNFIDRGIIPGSTNEFNAFIQSDRRVKNLLLPIRDGLMIMEKEY